MKEIDRLLKQWIPVNTIIRGEIRAAIVKEINAKIRNFPFSFISGSLDFKDSRENKIPVIKKTNTIERKYILINKEYCTSIKPSFTPIVIGLVKRK